MKMLVANRRFFMLILPFLLALFVLVGCGEVEEDNTQPVIESISDQTLDVGDIVEMNVSITDADVDDTHTIRAASSDTGVVITSVNGRTVSITGLAAGVATITVSVTDDSGQDNAAATPLTFRVNVEKNTQPVIEVIPDQTLDLGATLEVTVRVADTDSDDTHTMSVISDDTNVATVLMRDTIFIIEAVGAGVATITVSATDDSGQENAAATPLTFKVTVNELYTPLKGLIVSNGRVQLIVGGIFLSAGRCIILGGTTLNGVKYNTHNSKWQRRENAASPWTDIPGTESDEGLCSYSPPSPGQYRLVGEISIDGVRGKYASVNILTVE